MKRLGLIGVVMLALVGVAVAMQPSKEEIQQRAAAAKEAAARNQEALRSYSWVATTEIKMKGEVKNTKVESCQYGSDGKVQKTELSASEPEPEQKSRGRRRRGGGVKNKVVAKKKGEMQEELQSAAALVQSYVPPSPEKLQAVIAAGGVSHADVGNGAVAVKFSNYEKDGDSLTLTLDTEGKKLQKVAVATWLDEPDNPVTLDVGFQSLTDGTNYAASTLFKMAAKEIEVDVANSNYQKLTP